MADQLNPGRTETSLPLQNEKGLSLLETLFAVGIIIVMAASFYQLLNAFYENYEVQEAIAETQQQGRVTADLFWQEIRNTGLDPTGALFDPDNANQTKAHRKVYRGTDCLSGPHGVEKILVASPTVFHFLADLNQNGKVNLADDSEEHVRYEWVGDSAADSKQGTDPDLCGTDRASYTLYRDTGNGMREAASNITAFNLQYFDEDGAQLPVGILSQSDRERIRRVVIDLTAQRASSADDEYGERRIQTEIWLRNL